MFTSIVCDLVTSFSKLDDTKYFLGKLETEALTFTTIFWDNNFEYSKSQEDLHLLFDHHHPLYHLSHHPSPHHLSLHHFV